ncbi:hypothetical protein CYMTET_23734 [Cymbomonas tetramitiformis]|uniref:Myb-like domain-containing protein n=1 Tax=Cymbomonas tetramitiformis TaxID=36881 RepID=A0AAE0FXM1_9CHLO|nr:hypothetical protein CYMTET_23734 [Cymbomonas tetramitiformis]
MVSWAHSEKKKKKRKPHSENDASKGEARDQKFSWGIRCKISSEQPQKHGPFSQVEIYALVKTFLELAEMNNEDVVDPMWLLRKEAGNKKLLYFKTFAKTLPRRSPSAVYEWMEKKIRLGSLTEISTGRKLYEKWTAEENKRFLERCEELHDVKNKWKILKDEFQRHNKTLKDRQRYGVGMKSSFNKWTPEEDIKLLEFIERAKNHQRRQGITARELVAYDTRDNLPWQQISEQLHEWKAWCFRSSKACANRWYSFLSVVIPDSNPWTPEEDLELIDRVGESAVEEESEVDFHRLVQGRDGPETKKRWRRHVKSLQGWSRKSFQEHVAELTAKYSEMHIGSIYYLHGLLGSSVIRALGTLRTPI